MGGSNEIQASKKHNVFFMGLWTEKATNWVTALTCGEDSGLITSLVI